jgi:hypothetical protein
MTTIAIDAIVFDSVMGDLVGRDRSPSAFLVYLLLWSRAAGARTRSARISHQAIADATHLSKSAVQGAIALLNRRKLVRTEHDSRTAVPEHFVLRPWTRR